MKVSKIQKVPRFEKLMHDDARILAKRWGLKPLIKFNPPDVIFRVLAFILDGPFLLDFINHQLESRSSKREYFYFQQSFSFFWHSHTSRYFVLPLNSIKAFIFLAVFSATWSNFNKIPFRLSQQRTQFFQPLKVISRVQQVFK